MTQDALDDLRVIDQRHDAHLVPALRAQQRIDLPDLLDQLTPRSPRNAPRFEREMLDDFNRCAYFGATPLLCCCRLARGLLCMLPTLVAHFVGGTSRSNFDPRHNDLLQRRRQVENDRTSHGFIAGDGEVRQREIWMKDEGGGDLALLLGNWGDAPRDQIAHSDCPPCLMNP